MVIQSAPLPFRISPKFSVTPGKAAAEKLIMLNNLEINFGPRHGADGVELEGGKVWQIPFDHTTVAAGPFLKVRVIGSEVLGPQPEKNETCRAPDVNGGTCR